MELKNAVVLVTGANRGIGREFARQALARGARKVYAGTRRPEALDLPGAEALRLDVNDPADIAEAVRRAGDVTLLVNNAGIGQPGGFLDGHAEQAARTLLETNFYGPLRMSQAFAPVIEANGGGAILNVLSVASWLNLPHLGVYGATKSAAWALTNGLRHELRSRGVQVLGLHMGFVNTDLIRGFDVPKTAPDVIVGRAYDALEAGADEVLADELTQQVKQGLSAEPAVYLHASA